MNSNQRSEANNQSNNGGNEMDVSSARAGTVDRNNMNQSQQSGTLNGSSTQQGSEQSTDRTGSQTDTSAQRQGMPQERQSNDVAGGLPKSPGGNRQSADEKMDDDTGLSNTANREPSELDQNLRQERQSNVGRRDDGTPD
jgi:hypothetical protein